MESAKVEIVDRLSSTKSAIEAALAKGNADVVTEVKSKIDLLDTSVKAKVDETEGDVIAAIEKSTTDIKTEINTSEADIRQDVKGEINSSEAEIKKELENIKTNINEIDPTLEWEQF